MTYLGYKKMGVGDGKVVDLEVLLSDATAGPTTERRSNAARSGSLSAGAISGARVPMRAGPLAPHDEATPALQNPKAPLGSVLSKRTLVRTPASSGVCRVPAHGGRRYGLVPRRIQAAGSKLDDGPLD